MFYPFEAKNLGGDLLQLQRLSFHDDRFETRIVINMNVRARNDLLEVMVLEIGQYSFKLALVVIVDKCNNSERRGIGVMNCFIDKLLPDKIADGFGGLVYPRRVIRRSNFSRRSSPIETPKRLSFFIRSTFLINVARV